MIAQRPIERTVPPTHVMGIARFERASSERPRGSTSTKRISSATPISSTVRSAIFSFAARPSLRPMGATSSSLSISRSPKGCRKASTGSRRSTRDRFKEIDETIELRPILDRLIANPPLDLDLGEETEAELYAVAGGLSLALARTFKIIDPDLKNPQARHWERSFQIFDLLL